MFIEQKAMSLKYNLYICDINFIQSKFLIHHEKTLPKNLHKDSQRVQSNE